jgi:hypothetical protein
MKQRFTVMFLAALLLTGATSKEELRSSLVTVEGTVTGVGSAQGEGDLEALSVTLAPKDGEGKELNLLLAPRSTLDEVEFQVEQGDRIQAGSSQLTKAPRKCTRCATSPAIPCCACEPFIGSPFGTAPAPGRGGPVGEPWGDVADTDSTGREATAQGAENRTWSTAAASANSRT